jgi:hypothetical protein
VGRKRKKFCCMFYSLRFVLFFSFFFCSIGMKFGERLFGAVSIHFTGYGVAAERWCE